MPSVGQRCGVVVRGDDPIEMRKAEQRHHREVGFPMTPVRGRVDEPHVTVRAPDDVARPQVAVDAGRRLIRTSEIMDSPHRLLDDVDLLDGQSLAVDGCADVRHHAPRRVELGPSRQRPVGQRRKSDVAVAVGTELVSSGSMCRGQASAEAFRKVVGRFARLDPGEHDAVGGDGQDLRDFGAVGVGEPSETVGLALEEVLRRLRTGLDDGVATVGETQSSGGADVPAGDRRGRHDAVADERLRARRGACHPCHGVEVTGSERAAERVRSCCERATVEAPKARLPPVSEDGG